MNTDVSSPDTFLHNNNGHNNNLGLVSQRLVELLFSLPWPAANYNYLGEP